MAMPLYRLMRKGVAFRWTPDCQQAFDAIKRALTEAPCLAFLDFTQPFEVHTDASLAGIGATLYQNERPIAFGSRQLAPAEVNYTTAEQELLVVVHALTVWRCYLEVAPEFRVVTDHKAITFLDTVPQLSRRQTRWAEFLSRFHFRWDHLAGKSNVVADALSQNPSGYTPPNFFLNGIVVSGCLVHPTHLSHRLPSVGLRGVLCAVTRACGSPSAVPPREARTWKDKFEAGYRLDAWFQEPKNVEALVPHYGFVLYDGQRIVVPDAFGLRANLLEEMRTSPYAGHLGVNKTLKMIARH
jgi:RNase H-like domain found in reverse transcriptase